MEKVLKRRISVTLSTLGKYFLITSFMSVGLAPIVLSVKAQRSNQTNIRTLLPERVYEFTLRGGETHLYRVQLKAGQYFHLDVDQRGINVQLALRGADGKVLSERDRPNGLQGPETLSFIAMSTGVYRLEVSALDHDAEAGKYALRSKTPHKPAAQDKKRVAAETLLEEASQLSDTKTAEAIERACRQYEVAAKLWGEIGDKYAEALTQTNLGYGREDLSQDEKAIAAHERALVLYNELRNKEGVAHSLGHLSMSNAVLQNIDKAIEQCHQATVIFKELNDAESVTILNKSLAGIYLHTGYALFQKQEAELYPKALRVLDLARLLYGQLEDKPKLALALAALGRLTDDSGEKHKAIEYYNQALALVRAAADETSESVLLHNLGAVYDDLDEKDEALDYYNQALSIRRKTRDKAGEAGTLNSIGLIYRSLGEKPKALACFDQALTLAREARDRSVEATTLNNIGLISSSLGQNQKALDEYNQSLELMRAEDDKSGQATALTNIGLVFSLTGQKEKALEYFNQALPLTVAIGDKSGQAWALNGIGGVYDDLGNKEKALDLYNQSLSLSRTLGDKSGEANALNNIGLVYGAFGEKPKALGYFEQALTLMRKARDRSGEAAALSNMAGVYSLFGDKPKALAYFNQALTLMQAIDDRLGEARTLGNIGGVYDELDDKQKALDYNTRALLRIKAVGDKLGEGTALNNLGLVYSSIGEKQKALDYFNQARSIYVSAGNKVGEAHTLNNFGGLYNSLGNKTESLDYYNQALKLMRDLGDRIGEAATLSNIGLVYSSTGDSQKALDYYLQSLPLRRASRDRVGEATTLNNLGLVYTSTGDDQRALEYYGQALKLMREVGDRSGEANTLSNLGAFYNLTGDHRKALEYYSEALPLVNAIDDTLGRAVTFNNMMLASQLLKNTRLAVFYGKQSVNAYQQVRSTYQELKDKELKKTFLQSVEISYRSLTELLIDQGRLAEAVQVLNAFKDQQYFDFNTRAIKNPSPLAPTEREDSFASSYEITSKKAGQLKLQLEELNQTIGDRKPAADEGSRPQQLNAELKTATDAFRTTIKQAETEFGDLPDALKDKSPGIQDIDQMQMALGRLNKETNQTAVAIYTLVGKNNFRALIITSKDIIPITSSVAGTDLNKTAKMFFAQLSEFDKEANEPKFALAEVQDTGKKLYDFVFAPIAAKLKELKLNPRVLMWSLDGQLRYVPMAALYDGNNYLAQKYRNVVFTRADAKRMLSPVSRTWIGSGFYTSKEHTTDVTGRMEVFPALRNAKAEVQTIFGISPSKGILGGEFLGDQYFDKDSFLQKLALHRPLVHIASHFRLVPGDANASFLLLGNGEQLSLTKIREQPDDLFEHVELMTLSACETGIEKGRESDGQEIDSFAELVQRKMAQSILASLWKVDDRSTSKLMTQFYQTRQLKNLTKAEALQRAQLDVLKDEHSHPYYWAPFILIGNWR